MLTYPCGLNSSPVLRSCAYFREFVVTSALPALSSPLSSLASFRLLVRPSAKGARVVGWAETVVVVVVVVVVWLHNRPGLRRGALNIVRVHANQC